MASLRILNIKGDTSVMWAPERVGVDEETAAAVKEAERIFRDARSSGATAFRTDIEPAERVETFDPTLEQEIIIVPRIAGGVG